jgi:hypothetical protein
MMEQGQARPFCFSCGYDLSGLDLPHPCPECGHLADPERQIDEARRWFAGRRAWLWLFTRSSKIPPALLYALHDPTSSRLARRRMFLGIIFPALLSAFIVFGGSTIGVEKRYKVWYYNPADPDQTPRRVRETTEIDNLYQFNLHFDFDFSITGLFFPPPASWVQQRELLPGQSLVFVWPPSFDLYTLANAGVPWILLLFGYVPCWLILMSLGKRALLHESNVNILASIRSSLALPHVGLAMVCWIWFLLVVLSGISDLMTALPTAYFVVLDILGFVFVASLVVGGWNALFSWPRFIRLEKAGRLFPLPVFLAILLILINLGGPVGFASFVVWLIS